MDHLTVKSHLYSLSFEPKADWSREYSGQEEIHQYLVDLAHKYHLYKHIRFNSAVSEARWDPITDKWRLEITRLGGKEAEIGSHYAIHADFMVSAVGQLNVPKYPDLKGFGDFKGKIMHSARWDWDYDLRGKRVGIVGTGASAAQIIPAISAACKTLTVFQRTPSWVLPRLDKPIGRFKQQMYKHVPLTRRRHRASIMDVRENHFLAGFDGTSSEHDVVTRISKQHMLAQLGGDSRAGLRQKLTPNYPFNCKRIVLSDDYYLALAQNDVFLETLAISKLSAQGISMHGGSFHELDLIIFATGFRTTQFMYPIKVFGSKGISLEDIWSQGAQAYLGITVQELPNFAMLYGPNTNLAYNSLILPIEAQSLYINALISAVRGSKAQGKTLWLKPRPQVVREYNEHIQKRLAVSTFADSSCTSWFKNEAGKITNNWCDSAIAYQKRTCFVDWSDFELSGTAAPEIQKLGVTRWKRVVEETTVSGTVLGLVGLVAIGSCIIFFSLIRYLTI